jgi:hypothetical protein
MFQIIRGHIAFNFSLDQLSVFNFASTTSSLIAQLPPQFLHTFAWFFATWASLAGVGNDFSSDKAVWDVRHTLRAPTKITVPIVATWPSDEGESIESRETIRRCWDATLESELLSRKIVSLSRGKGRNVRREFFTFCYRRFGFLQFLLFDLCGWHGDVRESTLPFRF